MALVGKTITIGDREYVISQFDALMAIDVGCLAQQWRARQIGKASSGLHVDGAGKIGAHAEGLYAGLELVAQMYASPEFRSKVFFPTLELCTCAGKPVIDRDGVWKLTYAGADLLNLLRLFQAALEHACGGFFLATSGEAGTNAEPPPAEVTP